MLNFSAATMFSAIKFSVNKIRFIFIVFMVMCSISESFRLHKNVTAMRGGNISLPCDFSVHAHAVYWYKHTFTGAPVEGASLVARDYQGITDPLQGFERFSITKDYSLIIRNIIVHDETTYSCLVVDLDTLDVDEERGYTDLRVIALAEPLEPIIEIIEPCTFTAQGDCIYHFNRSTIGKDTSEDVILVSKLFNVRPLPNLIWIDSNGGLHEHATYQTQEKDGLFSISSQIQVSKSHLDHHYTCQAKGEAVNGTSSVEISFEDSATHVSDDRLTWIVVSVTIGTVLLVGVIVLSVCLIYHRIRGRLSCLTREYKDTKRSKKDGIFMVVKCKGNDEPDQDTERKEVEGISTTVVDNGCGEPGRDRRESNWWCTCGNCPVMQPDVQCLCCREVTRCREIQTNGCIVDSKEFKDVCFNESLINTFLTLRSKDHKIPGNMENESCRFAAYRLWSDYLHGYLGKGVRRPLPACVVTRVRQEFPEETGVYVGFEFGKGNVGKEESKCLLPEQR